MNNNWMDITHLPKSNNDDLLTVDEYSYKIYII